MARSDASIAVSDTSPSPWAKCGSPTYASAPSTCTGQVERRADGEQVDVDVAAVRAGRHRVRPRVARDGDAHDPEERRERERDRRLAARPQRQQAVGAVLVDARRRR